MPGRLFYVVGASGAGKDTLIDYARAALAGDRAVIFAHRYITRPAHAGGENHVALTEREFELRERHGLFAMRWESNGYRYGIGIEVDVWLARDLAVVVNGSRDYLPQARSRYPDVRAVWVSAGPELIAARLAQRGRESGAEVGARLERNARLGLTPPEGVLHVRNDGAIESAGARFIELLTAA